MSLSNEELIYDTFLSYHMVDKREARYLYDALREHGRAVWFDEQVLPGGADWQQRIENGLRSSRSVVVFLTGDPPHSGVEKEVSIALEIATERELPIIPLLRHGVDRRRALGDQLAGFHAVELPKSSSRWPEAVRRDIPIAMDTVEDEVALPGKALARDYLRRGDQARRVGQAGAARLNYQMAVEIRRRIMEMDVKERQYRMELASALTRLGTLERDTKRYGEAKKAIEEALTIRQAVSADSPEDPSYQRSLASTQLELGTLHRTAEKFDESRACMEEAHKIRRKLCENEPDNLLYRREFAGVLEYLGDLERRAQQWDVARDHYAGEVETRRKVVDDHVKGNKA